MCVCMYVCGEREVCVCMYVCVREIQRERERENVCMYVCMCERE